MQLNAFETSGVSPGKTNDVSKPTSTPTYSIGPRLLRIKEAADYLNATVWFVRSLVWSGFPHLRLGKRILLDRADLDLFVERQKTEVV
jgi:excisionase family DNA binding protein